MAAQLLVDSIPIQLQVIESDDTGKMVVRGEYAFLDRATANRRVYTESLMRRELGRLERNLAERRVFGELDHPGDGRTQLSRTSHIVTGLKIEGSRIIGESEVVDTQRGKDLQALFRSGARVGISSRGFGSTMANEKGEEVVQDDFRLVTFDFVADPANHTSYPDVYYEERKPEMTKQSDQLSDPAKLKEEFAEIVRGIFTEQRDAIREEERAKLLADPQTGIEKKVVEEIISLLKGRLLPEDAGTLVETKDAEIKKLKTELSEQAISLKSLQEENQKLSAVARDIGYKYFLEASLADDPQAEVIRKFVGDPTAFGSHEEITEAIEAARKELERHARLQEQEDRKRQRELQVIEEDKKKLKHRLDKVEEALEKSSRLNNILTVELYAERRLANHPKASEIRKVIESAEPETKDAVDEIIDGFRDTARDPQDQQHVRARIRAITGGGIGPSAIDEEKGSSEGGGGTEQLDYNNLGVPITVIKRLAGI